MRAASVESVSTASAGTSLSIRTTMTSVPSSSVSRDDSMASRPLAVRNGRIYLSDSSMPYPLPFDLAELHRQSLRTLLLIQLFGGPICCPALIKKPPQRVLEIGCGLGFWSMMCHEYYKSRGYGSISFTGIDIVPVGPGSNCAAAESIKPAKNMDWRFFQQGICKSSWSVLDYEEFDFIMFKDMSLAVASRQKLRVFGQYLRLLKPGGTIEIWESDHHIRMLRPHVRATMSTTDTGDRGMASKLGAYVLSTNTPLSAPINPFLIDYNNWLSQALEARELSAVPCTLIGLALLQEADTLVDTRSRRLAIPLGEVRWEGDEAGAVDFHNGKSNDESKGSKATSAKVDRTSLSTRQKALRATALSTVVQQVQALESILREVSGKSQDEWDA